MTQTTLAIIGGGIAGLSAAYYAQQHNIDYTLLEASSGWGGKIKTDVIPTESGDVVVEWGPDSFITQKPWALQLARELGLEDELLGTNDDKRQIYVLSNGRLKTLPDGMMLIIPTRFMPFALSPLISPLGKVRMGLESLIPAKQDNEDESLADFIRRRLGQEALDKLAEPLMSGIYNTDAETQSLLATFPRFRMIEQKYGSLTKGMLAAKKHQPPPTGKKMPMFMSFTNGMQTLVSALVDALDGDLRLNTSVQCIDYSDDGYTLQLNDGESLQAQHILLTTPSYVSARVLQSIAPTIATQLQQIEYVDTGTVSLVYRKADLAQLPDGFGVVIPRSEKRHINAITVSSTKFDSRAPDDLLLLRVFYGGARTPQTFAQDDETLLQVVQDELADILNITAEPLLSRIIRTKQATPQYTVGHGERVQIMEDALPDGLWLAGSAFHGVGVPDCVHQSQVVVDAIAEKLSFSHHVMA